MTKKIEKRGGRYKNPRVFTEQGIAMLATILKSDIAVEVSIRIMEPLLLCISIFQMDILSKDICKIC